MGWVEFIATAFFGVFCVVTYVWFGIFVGREFGTFENFVVFMLEKLEARLKRWG